MTAPCNDWAFPHEIEGNQGRIVYQGMTLRDYFAAAALQGLCANPGGPFQANGRSGWGLVNCKIDDVADSAYDIADAMLAERAK